MNSFRLGTFSRPVLVSAGVTLLAAAALAVYFLRGDPSRYDRVRHGDIVHSFIALGQVEAEQQVGISPEFAARIVRVHVEEGDEVRAGQVLVTLDTALLETQLQEARQAAAAAKAQWDRVLAGPRPEDLARIEAVVDECRHGLAAAEAQLAQVERGARPEELRAATALVRQAQADRDAARKLFDRTRAAGPRRRAQLEDDQRKLDGATALLEARQAQLEQIQSGATAEEEQQALAAVRAAQARLKQAQAELQKATAGASAEERRGAEAQYLQAAAVIERLEVMQGQARLASPLDGVVVRRHFQAGELAHPQMLQPILEVAAAGPRRCRVEVQEGDLYKLRIGQTAWITADGYLGQRRSAKVERIAPIMGGKKRFAELPGEKTDIRVVQVWIRPDEPLDWPLNLPVEAEVRETIRRDVLVAPSRALDENGRVRIPGGGGEKIVTGARDDGFVEIVAGLSAGDRVVVRN